MRIYCKDLLYILGAYDIWNWIKCKIGKQNWNKVNSNCVWWANLSVLIIEIDIDYNHY